MKLTFSFDNEGASRVFWFMDGVCDLYATLLDDRATTSLRKHLECFVSRQLDIEPFGRVTLHRDTTPGATYHTQLTVPVLPLCRDLAAAANDFLGGSHELTGDDCEGSTGARLREPPGRAQRQVG